jgi:hypothetical protein
VTQAERISLLDFRANLFLCHRLENCSSMCREGTLGAHVCPLVKHLRVGWRGEDGATGSNAPQPSEGRRLGTNGRVCNKRVGDKRRKVGTCKTQSRNLHGTHGSCASCEGAHRSGSWNVIAAHILPIRDTSRKQKQPCRKTTFSLGALHAPQPGFDRGSAAAGREPQADRRSSLMTRHDRVGGAAVCVRRAVTRRTAQRAVHAAFVPADGPAGCARAYAPAAPPAVLLLVCVGSAWGRRSACSTAVLRRAREVCACGRGSASGSVVGS